MNTPSFSDAKGAEVDVAVTGQSNKKPGAPWNKGGTKSQISTVMYGFEGAKSEIGAVLGLKHEKMKCKVTYDDFIEKFTTYLTSNLTGARDVVKTIIDKDNVMERIEKEMPEDLTVEEAKSAVRVLLKTEEVKKFGARRQLAKDNGVKTFGLLWGQCSPGLQTSIKGESGYEDAVDSHNLVWLLETVQKVVSGVDTKASKLYVEQEALVAFTTMRQGTTETTDGVIARVKHNAQTLKLAGGERYLVDKSGSTTKTQLEIDAAIEQYLAMHVIRRSDSARFGELQKSLLDGSHKGRDEYPVSLQEVYALLVRQPKEVSIGNRRTTARGQNNVMFAMVKGDGGDDDEEGNDGGKVVAGTDGRTVEAECYICHKKGHISWYCPEAGNTGPPPRDAKSLGCAQVGFMQKNVSKIRDEKSEKKDSVINTNWILLDTCSTASVCCNEELVRDIRKCETGEELTVITNGGKQTYKHMAILKDLPLQVYFKRDSLANIISLSDVANIPGVGITMDTRKERAIVVKMSAEKTFKFLECPDGLYHYDTSDMYNKLSKPKSNVTPYSFTMTVSDNKKYFSKREIARAEGAHRLQQTLGWPSVDQFRNIIGNNLVRNCSVTLADIDRAQYLFGTPTPLLQGKMTRSPNARDRIPRVSIPPSILTHHRNVILYVDYFFVNKLPFLHTKSEGLNHLTVQSGQTRSKATIIEGILKVMRIYHTRGFKVIAVHGDGEFDMDSLRGSIRPAHLEIQNRDEHDGVIERSVRTVKERSRCTCHALYHMSIIRS